MEHLSEEDVEEIAIRTSRKDRKASIITTVFTVLGGLCVPLLIWVSTQGEIYAQVKTNTAELKKREPFVDSVPVVQNDIEYIKGDIDSIQNDVEGIEGHIDSMKSDINDILIGIEGLKNQ
jgi:peptidoglycan hydrolase CwlO-like protein